MVLEWLSIPLSTYLAPAPKTLPFVQRYNRLLMKKQQSSLEEACQLLVGWQIVKVAYTEVDYYPAAPRPCYHTEKPNLHSVDFALSFYDTKGNAAIVVWQEVPTGGYELHLHQGVKQETAGQRTWDVSQDLLWQPFINTTITAVRMQQTTDAGHPSLILAFSNSQSIQIQAAELNTGSNGGKVESNNLLVCARDVANREP